MSVIRNQLSGERERICLGVKSWLDSLAGLLLTLADLNPGKINGVFLFRQDLQDLIDYFLVSSFSRRK